VLDYKTDGVEVDQLQERVDVYSPQPENYARVVVEQFGLEPEKITGKLVFLSVGSVVESNPAPSCTLDASALSCVATRGV